LWEHALAQQFTVARQMQKYARLAAFVIAIIGIGFSIGITNIPGAWYSALQKPPFNPPDWIFAPVWSVIYILIAVAGWRTWEKEGYGLAMSLWLLQMLLNFIWSPVFFSMHLIGIALAIISTLLVVIAGFIAERWRADRLAAALFLPYAAWVAFATLLNASIFALN
jgi:benzodiazapine receptor